MFDLKISNEEKFLINVLFNEKKQIEKEIDFYKINYDLLVKITSANLMLPSLYVNLQNKGFIKLIPKDLRKYLKEIYNINKNRNQNLVNEANEISLKLNENDINHVFIKGTSHIFKNIYNDIGQRMVGDIDILVSDKDYEKTIKLFKKFNYKKPKYSFDFNEKHYPRLINPKKKFAIEFHKRLLPKKYEKKLKSKIILESKINLVGNIYTPNNENELLHNIYNYQINDYGYFKLVYSYRSLYDSFKLIKQLGVKEKNIKTDKYINNYLMIAKELNVYGVKLSRMKINKINQARFKLKNSNKLYSRIDYYTQLIIKKIKIFPTQIFELMINEKYRKYALRKVFNKH